MSTLGPVNSIRDAIRSRQNGGFITPPGFVPPAGMAPPNQQPFQMPTAGNHMMGYGGQAQQLAGLLGGGMPPQGAYGAQAQQLAGLLGGGQQPMQPPYTPGRFMPGFRPGVDQPIQFSGGSQGRPGTPRQRY